MIKSIPRFLDKSEIPMDVFGDISSCLDGIGWISLFVEVNEDRLQPGNCPGHIHGYVRTCKCLNLGDVGVIINWQVLA